MRRRRLALVAIAIAGMPDVAELAVARSPPRAEPVTLSFFCVFWGATHRR